MDGEQEKTYEEKLVNRFFESVNSKTGTAMRAAFKKADNPDTEYQCWEYLAYYGVNLEYPEKRLPYITVFSSIANSDRSTDGSLKFGKALLVAYESDIESEPARARLRRVLACDSTEDVCKILRSVLRFINSKSVAISYASLLKELKYFDVAPEKIKAGWAQQFYENILKENKEDKK